MERRFVYEAVIEPGEVSGHYVWFPDLPDAFTQGADLKEAVLNAAEVLELTLADVVDEGTEPPVPTYGNDHDADAFTALVSVEMSDEKVRLMGFVGSTEAAQVLGVSKGRVAQLVASGQLESVGEGTARLVSLRSINQRLATRRGAGRPRKELAAV
jgi:predicted RNase H-like HicB family nuclease